MVRRLVPWSAPRSRPLACGARPRPCASGRRCGCLVVARGGTGVNTGVSTVGTLRTCLVLCLHAWDSVCSTDVMAHSIPVFRPHHRDRHHHGHRRRLRDGQAVPVPGVRQLRHCFGNFDIVSTHYLRVPNATRVQSHLAAPCNPTPAVCHALSLCPYFGDADWCLRSDGDPTHGGPTHSGSAATPSSRSTGGTRPMSPTCGGSTTTPG